MIYRQCATPLKRTVLYQRMVGQIVLGSFESFNLYALNQAHSTHHPVHGAYRYTSQITEPARGTILQYLPCATEADRNYRGNRVVQHKANSRPIVYRILPDRFSIRRHTVLGDVRCVLTAVFTVPYICNRVGTVSSCCGTRYRTHRRDRTGVHVRSTVAPVRPGAFRFSIAPVGEIAPGVRQNRRTA